MRSRRGVGPKQARDVADEIAPKARRHPDSVFVQLAATEAFLDARRFDEADAAADRALALDPRSTDALVFKGMIAIQRGKAGDKARFAAARAPLAKATRIDSQDPRPYILYYESFRRAGEKVPESAVAGLEQIFKEAAFDSDYRLLLARQLLIEGEGAAAQDVLGPITYGFHGDQKHNKLRPVVDLIKAGKVPEARAKLDELFKEAEEEEKKHSSERGHRLRSR
jgi:tetratricopeptide (TPR) repeat protein